MVLPNDLELSALVAPDGCGPQALASDALSAEVFVVDDEQSELGLIERALESSGYRVRGFDNPEQALEALNEGAPSVVVTDLKMPTMSGIEFGLAVRELDPYVKVILLTGLGSESTAREALRLGVSDYLTKPADPDELEGSVRRAVIARASELHHLRFVGWMREELDRREDVIRQLTVQTLSVLVNTQDARSPHFRGHSQAVAMQASAIAQTLDLHEEDVEMIRTAGMLHDVGMISVPDYIVQKPDTLSADEFDVVRDHCAKGAEILAPLEHLGPAIRYVEEHHERWDGSGYPTGKEGGETSLGGQVLGIAEAWISLISSRPYRSEVSRLAAQEILERRVGEWFSKEITDALLASDVGLM